MTSPSETKAVYITVAGIVGIVLGAMGMRVLQAQTATVPAFLVGNTQEVTDPDLFGQYRVASAKTESAYGARLIARGVPSLLDAPRSTQPKGDVVIIQFPSMKSLQAWWRSPEYAAIRPMREKATSGQIYVIEGVPTP